MLRDLFQIILDYFVFLGPSLTLICIIIFCIAAYFCVSMLYNLYDNPSMEPERERTR